MGFSLSDMASVRDISISRSPWLLIPLFTPFEIIILKRRKNQICQSYLSFLQALDSLLRLQIDHESFKQQVGNIHGIENLLEGNAGEHGYLSSLFYLLQLSMDRYNVAYPKYDMKTAMTMLRLIRETVGDDAGSKNKRKSG